MAQADPDPTVGRTKGTKGPEDGTPNWWAELKQAIRRPEEKTGPSPHSHQEGETTQNRSEVKQKMEKEVQKKETTFKRLDSPEAPLASTSEGWPRGQRSQLVNSRGVLTRPFKMIQEGIDLLADPYYLNCEDKEGEPERLEIAKREERRNPLERQEKTGALTMEEAKGEALAEGLTRETRAPDCRPMVTQSKREIGGDATTSWHHPQRNAGRGQDGGCEVCNHRPV
jgi:hypothetical protein